MDTIIIPCTKEKIWDNNPKLGAVAAKDAYTKPVFLKWREYAEQSDCPWLILSTKYGLIKPDKLIKQYNIPIFEIEDNEEFLGLLKQQASRLNLQQYQRIIVLDWEALERLLRRAIPRLPLELKKLYY
jgi:hypothetical protein